MSFIRDNGGVLVIVGIVAAILAGYAEWRIDVAVTDKLEKANIVSPDKIGAMEGDISDLKRADDKMDDKITRIIDILLEE